MPNMAMTCHNINNYSNPMRYNGRQTQDFIRLNSSGDESNNGYSCHKTAQSKRKRTYKLSEYGSNLLAPFFPNPDAPWKTKVYTPDIIGLHNEIEDFSRWMRPTKEETMLRGCVVERIKRIVHQLWPTARVDIFGSFKTGLYLPTSDIDIVIFGEWSVAPLRTLERRLIDNNIAEPSSIKVLDKASVPIIKLTDTLTKIKLDISFNTNNSIKSAEKISELLQQYPCLDKLVLVLKQFLLQRNLNEVFVGGLGSYCLTLMVVAKLQSCPRHRRGRLEDENLGVLLIEFFEFYGVRFNYNNTGIRIHDGGSFFNKNDIAEMKGSMLCIEDPFQPGNDIARASYCMYIVKEAFKVAYLWLKRAVIAPRKPSEQVFPLTDSILGTIVKVDRGIVEYRSWILNTWVYLARRLPHPESYTHNILPLKNDKPKRERRVTLSRPEDDFSDDPTDHSAEASSDDSDRLTDDLSSDSSV